MNATQRINFLECPIDAVSTDQTIEHCINWCTGERRPHTLITVNAAILVMMRRDDELRHAATAGDLIVPDGMSVVWGSRIVGSPLVERVAGVDLMLRLLEVADERGLRAFFLGAKQEVIERLVEDCRRKYPNLIVAGARNGYFSEDEHPQVIDEIHDSAADILFVGMPTPFKEVWCQRHREALGIPLIMGVGGSFDVLAGFITRAPRWMQRIGMEWSWRLIMEPRKMWKRYLVTNSMFIWLTLRRRFSFRPAQNCPET